MTTRFRWREGSRVRNLTASVAARRIGAIRRELRRDVRPADILEDARRKDSPLHAAFEWDNGVAAEKWRLAQAQSIMVSIEIVSVENQHAPVRAFVRVHRDEEKPAYMPIAEAMANRHTRDQVLKIAKHEAKMWASRYRRYEEFSRVVEVIDEVAV